MHFLRDRYKKICDLIVLCHTCKPQGITAHRHVLLQKRKKKKKCIFITGLNKCL